MSEELFPSGPWVGFYNYYPGDRHRMDLDLIFANGMIKGDGNDDIGRFLINGHYDTTSHECHWTKSYAGAHDVFYHGFREGKGIWGTWEIGLFGRGGFHIWPRRVSEGEEWQETSEKAEPFNAIGSVVRQNEHSGQVTYLATSDIFGIEICRPFGTWWGSRTLLPDFEIERLGYCRVPSLRENFLLYLLFERPPLFPSASCLRFGRRASHSTLPWK